MATAMQKERRYQSWEQPPMVITQRKVIATIVADPDSNLNQWEAAYVAIARNDEDGTYDFESVLSDGAKVVTTVTIARQFIRMDGEATSV